jgi:hypothetical protein
MLPGNMKPGNAKGVVASTWHAMPVKDFAAKSAPIMNDSVMPKSVSIVEVLSPISLKLYTAITVRSARQILLG